MPDYSHSFIHPYITMIRDLPRCLLAWELGLWIAVVLFVRCRPSEGHKPPCVVLRPLYGFSVIENQKMVLLEGSLATITCQMRSKRGRWTRVGKQPCPRSHHVHILKAGISGSLTWHKDLHSVLGLQFQALWLCLPLVTSIVWETTVAKLTLPYL